MISVSGDPETGPRIQPANLMVPGDFSSAAFWMAAAACREGAVIRCDNVGLNGRRTAFLDVLKRMGAGIETAPVVAPAGAVRTKAKGDKGNPVPAADSGSDWEPAGHVTVCGRGLKGTEVGGDEIPNLIDELPLVGVVGALAEGQTVIRDAAELRVKESDRIAAMCATLSAFGVKVEEKPDGMVIQGRKKVKGGAQVESLGDHRIAMAAAILSLFADSAVRLNEVACIATSYPTFWSDLSKVAAIRMAE